MILFVRFVRKELFEVLRRPVALLGLFAISLFMILVVGQLNERPAKTRVLLLSSQPTDNSAVEKPEVSALAERVLREFADITLVRDPGTTENLSVMMNRNNSDIAIVLWWWPYWQIYERSATQDQHLRQIQVASFIGWSLRSERPWVLELLQKAEFTEMSGVTSLYSAPGRNNRSLVPKTIALMMVILPFVLASRSYVREIAFGTLPTLLICSNGTWPRLLAGKLFACLWIASSVLLFILICTRPLYNFHVKPGLFAILGIQLLSMYVSASIGLIMAMMARSYIQVYVGATAYFLALVLLTGFFFPLEEASFLIQITAHVLPLTFSNGPLTSWMFYGSASDLQSEETVWLIGQVLAASCLLFVATRVARRRL